MLNRRTLLISGASTVVLAGCASGTFNVSAFAQAVQAIGTEIGSVVTLLPSSVPAATVSEIQTIVAAIQSLAAGAGTAASQVSGQALLQQIEGYINELAPIVLSILPAIPGVGSIASILGIIVAALPAIEAMVNIVSTFLSTTAQSLASAAPPLPASGRLRAMPSVSVSQQYLNMLEHKASARLGRKLHYR